MLGFPPCRFCVDSGWRTDDQGILQPCYCNPRGLSTAEHQALKAEAIRCGRTGSRKAGVYRGSAVKSAAQLVALGDAGRLNLQAKE